MRIYKVNIEHADHGLNYTSTQVAARNFEEAVSKAKKKLEHRESVESVELIAVADD
ncbi:MAG: hypothetical protein JWQ87_2041 [Candidatus Sulfotelmatobacter sp.]|nr:hypothetical protein [Candidatus Sulfotelmatobacter sp.]